MIVNRFRSESRQDETALMPTTTIRGRTIRLSDFCRISAVRQYLNIDYKCLHFRRSLAAAAIFVIFAMEA